MQVTFPHMGYIYVGIEAMARRMGANVIVPPPTNQRTLTLGVKYSPEMVCLPFKLSLGNMIEALELGADTIIMPGGLYGCRFGYYHKTQEAILRKLGYNFEMVTQDLGIMHMVKQVTQGIPLRKIITGLWLGLAKMKILHELEQLTQRIRAVERDRGVVTQIHRKATRAVENASGCQELRRVRQEYVKTLKNLPTISPYVPLKIGITGEFFIAIDPFANMNLDIELGRLGVEVHRVLNVGEWIRFNPIPMVLGLREKDRSNKAAMPYLSRNVFGDGWQSIGEKVLHARDWDGVVHVEPFSCLPEIIARNIMPSTEDGLPILNLIFDEHTAKAGVINRLEAFVDMLRRRKRGKVEAYF